MKPIYNKILPIKGFKAINLFGIIFVRKGLRMSKTDINHERIHTHQMLEMLIVFFYLFYIIEWVIKLLYYRNGLVAYQNLSFEREAYFHQNNLYYLEKRNHYEWFKLIRLK
ncbi:MAG: hypothetical protein MJZ34_09495 [Paludibacteraceae bacterium]|nr:hypothetical protein [Paludibacteraceae bacterium]